MPDRWVKNTFPLGILGTCARLDHRSSLPVILKCQLLHDCQVLYSGRIPRARSYHPRKCSPPVVAGQEAVGVPSDTVDVGNTVLDNTAEGPVETGIEIAVLKDGEIVFAAGDGKAAVAVNVEIDAAEAAIAAMETGDSCPHLREYQFRLLAVDPG